MLDPPSVTTEDKTLLATNANVVHIQQFVPELMLFILKVQGKTVPTVQIKLNICMYFVFYGLPEHDAGTVSFTDSEYQQHIQRLSKSR